MPSCQQAAGLGAVFGTGDFQLLAMTKAQYDTRNCVTKMQVLQKPTTPKLSEGHTWHPRTPLVLFEVQNSVSPVHSPVSSKILAPCGGTCALSCHTWLVVRQLKPEPVLHSSSWDHNYCQEGMPMTLL